MRPHCQIGTLEGVVPERLCMREHDHPGLLYLVIRYRSCILPCRDVRIENLPYQKKPPVSWLQIPISSAGTGKIDGRRSVGYV
jgi:hypothetical protein